MVKKHATKIAVLGGRQGHTQFYTGTVDGHSTSFTVIDSEVKTAQVKVNEASPAGLYHRILSPTRSRA